jgi:hypothetical protein
MLVDKNAPISRSMQRWFGLSLAALITLIAFGARNTNPWTLPIGLSAAALLAITYYSCKRSQIPVIRGWQTLTYPIGFLAGHVLLGSIYWTIAVPIGLVMRLLQYDPLRLRKTPSAAERDTNWQERPSQPKSMESYFRQY